MNIKYIIHSNKRVQHLLSNIKMYRKSYIIYTPGTNLIDIANCKLTVVIKNISLMSTWSVSHFSGTDPVNATHCNNNTGMVLFVCTLPANNPDNKLWILKKKTNSKQKIEVTWN